MKKNSGDISLLLGAGFSAPVGYPVGSKLNELILGCKNENIAFHTSGSLVVNRDGTMPDLGFKSSHQIEFEYFCKLLQYYTERNGRFDYEEFFDYISINLDTDEGARNLAKDFANENRSVDSLLSGQRKILNQIASYFLRDRNDRKFYDDLPYFADKDYPGYTGILNCISDLSRNNTIHIHTLNHDLFFESFNRTDFFKGELCDGFEELGSKYFGKLNVEGRDYKVRLERYTGKYNTRLRLYKLHGSLDYELFYKSKNGQFFPDAYIKSRYGIGHTEQFKEVALGDGEFEYQNSWINYHSDFLSGTTSKILRYDEPLLFNKLVALFRSNLNKSDMLIIVGYGCKDKGINEMIFQNYRFWRSPITIIDPYPGKQVVDFAWKIQARVVKKQLEDIDLSMLL